MKQKIINLSELTDPAWLIATLKYFGYPVLANELQSVLDKNKEYKFDVAFVSQPVKEKKKND